jgi:hypothetical protein
VLGPHVLVRKKNETILLRGLSLLDGEMIDPWN